MIELESGALFGGRYQVVNCIGSGGMGVVYLARDPRYKNFQVAIKVLYPGALKSAASRERFRTEIVASYRVNHRHVVRAYEYFDDDGIQAYAMEYVDGQDLQILMHERRLGTTEVLAILQQCAAGLEAIHHEGILHRDLKPENILITKKGTVKISDFGVARLKGDFTSITKAGIMVGTPKYISPEYVETGESDQRGDIYALGVIGYEMLAGTSPFKANTGVSLMIERFKVQPPSVLRYNAQVPLDLARIIKKAMNFALSDRYQSAGELCEDLDRFAADRPLKYAAREEIEVDAAEREESDILVVSRSPGAQATAHTAGALQLSGTTSAAGDAAVYHWGLTWLAVAVSVVLLLVVGAAATALYLHPKFLSQPPPVPAAGRYRGFLDGVATGAGAQDLKLLVGKGEVHCAIADQPCETLNHDRWIFTCDAELLQLELQLKEDTHIGGSARRLGREGQGGEGLGRWTAVRLGED